MPHRVGRAARAPRPALGRQVLPIEPTLRSGSTRADRNSSPGGGEACEHCHPLWTSSPTSTPVGSIHDSTDRDVLAARLDEGPIGVYDGFDPTADSLHVGHLIGQVIAAPLPARRAPAVRRSPAGRPGMVGDPSGRSPTSATCSTATTLDHNVAAIKRQLDADPRLRAGPTQATLVDNADWTEPMSAARLPPRRRQARHRQPDARQGVGPQARLESEHGISFTEFSYMLLQANDFRYLLRAPRACEVQIGRLRPVGQHHRRRRPDPPHAGAAAVQAFTLAAADAPPTARSSARPTGGTVWLDADQDLAVPVPPVLGADRRRRWSPIQLRMFSLRPWRRSTSSSSSTRRRPERRLAQRALAGELTAMVHGEDAGGRRRGGRRRAVRRRPDDRVAGGVDALRRRGARRRRSSRRRSTTSVRAPGRRPTWRSSQRRRTPHAGSTRVPGQRPAARARHDRPFRCGTAPRAVCSPAEGTDQLPPRRNFFDVRLTAFAGQGSVSSRSGAQRCAAGRHQRLAR